MALSNQIIAFIDPFTFGSLLGAKRHKIGFVKVNEDEEDIYLAGNSKVVYTGLSGRTEIDKIDSQKAMEAAVLLVPDNLLLDYQPAIPFKILYHGVTQKRFPHHYLPLKASVHCVGCHQDREDQDTIYAMIAGFIDQGDQTVYHSIWSAIPEINFVLEAKLELLHACMHHNDVPNQLDPILNTYSNAFEAFKTSVKGLTLFDPLYIKALTALRIQLLGE